MLVVTISGQKKAVQFPRKVKIASAESAGCHQWQGDFPPDLEFVQPIDARRLEEIVRYRFEELFHQEGAEGRHHAGEHDAPVAVEPAQLAGHQIPGNDQHFRRYHQCRQDREEDEITAPKLEFRQGITNQTVEKAVGDGNENRNQRRVEEPAQETAIGHHGHVVRNCRCRGNEPEIIDLIRRLERGCEHEQQRRNHDQAANEQQRPGDDAAGADAGVGEWQGFAHLFSLSTQSWTSDTTRRMVNRTTVCAAAYPIA